MTLTKNVTGYFKEILSTHFAFLRDFWKLCIFVKFPCQSVHFRVVLL